MSLGSRLLAVALVFSAASAGSAHATWTPDGAPLLPGSGLQNIRSMLPDGSGGAFFAWEQGGGDLWQVAVQHVNASGDFVAGWPSDGLPMSDPVRNLISGTWMFFDASKRLYVTWVVRQDTAKTLVYLRCVDDKGAPAPGWSAAGIRVGLGVGVDFRVRMVPDGTGGVIVAWGPASPQEDTPNEIRAQRVDALGRTLWDTFGRTFVPTADDLIGPALATDGAGGAVIGWSSGAGNQGQIYVTRITGQGGFAPGWSSSGVAVASTPGARVLGQMVSDGAGGAIVGWNESRVVSGPADQNVYAQRVLASGVISPDWSPNGNAVCAQPKNQTSPFMCMDEAGGAILAWNDFRPLGAATNIVAQRIDSKGRLLWAVAGVSVCTAVNIQRINALSSDGAGGAWLAWEDWRNGFDDSDIYGTHLLADSRIDPEFPVNGAAACAAGGIQSSPMLAVDPGFKPIIAWPDTRLSFPATQIYLTQLVNPASIPSHGPDPSLPGSPVLKRFAARLSPSARLSFALPAAGITRLEIFDVNGRRLESRDLGMLAAGDHSVQLGGLEGRPAGVYIMRLRQGESAWTSRLVLLK